jgi:hypothetical protein
MPRCSNRIVILSGVDRFAKSESMHGVEGSLPPSRWVRPCRGFSTTNVGKENRFLASLRMTVKNLKNACAARLEAVPFPVF